MSYTPPSTAAKQLAISIQALIERYRAQPGYDPLDEIATLASLLAGSHLQLNLCDDAYLLDVVQGVVEDTRKFMAEGKEDGSQNIH